MGMDVDWNHDALLDIAGAAGTPFKCAVLLAKMRRGLPLLHHAKIPYSSDERAAQLLHLTRCRHWYEESSDEECDEGGYRATTMRKVTHLDCREEERLIQTFGRRSSWKMAKWVIDTLGGWDGHLRRVERAKRKEFLRCRQRLNKSVGECEAAAARLPTEVRINEKRRIEQAHIEQADREAAHSIWRAKLHRKEIEELERKEAARPKWKVPHKQAPKRSRPAREQSKPTPVM